MIALSQDIADGFAFGDFDGAVRGGDIFGFGGDAECFAEGGEVSLYATTLRGLLSSSCVDIEAYR